MIEKKTWLALRLVVESDKQPLLNGKIRLHLHPTFEHSSYKVDVDADAARETIEATGAFTVGVEADQGLTRLELDLATETSLPAWFRQR